jgi:hypothetical protein
MRYLYLAPVKSPADRQRAIDLPRMSKAGLATLIKDRIETKVISPASGARSAARRAALAKTVQSELAAALKGSKSVLLQLSKRSANDRARPASHVHERTDHHFRLLSAQAILDDAYALGVMRGNSAMRVRNFEGLKALFDKNVASLSDRQSKQIDKVSSLHGLKAVDIAARQTELLRMWRDWALVRPVIATDLTRPGPEIGEGDRCDRSGEAACAGEPANPKGLISLHRWPLKRHITSVKNQGNRGTCSVFGTVAAVEAAISVKYGKKVNLSEQDLYKKQRLDWNPNPLGDYNEDGYFPLLSMLFQLVTGYTFPFERDWDYNPSWSRTPSGEDGPWTGSCDGYNGLACSDTNHQAKCERYVIPTSELKEVVSEVCEFIDPVFGDLGRFVCDTTTDLIEVVDQTTITVYETIVPGTSRYKVSQWLPVWDPIGDRDLSAAKLLLAGNVPLIFCFVTPGSWYASAHTGPNGKGYLVHNRHEAFPSDPGGHCVAIVGNIDNADIPADWYLEPGAGGGYFIIKNSWGACWADRGYAYAPYAWVDQWGTSIVAISQVERV